MIRSFPSMNFDRQYASAPEIPNPTEHARVILEICQNDVDEARAIAVRNFNFARSEDDILYWSRVTRALTLRNARY